MSTTPNGPDEELREEGSQPPPDTEVQDDGTDLPAPDDPDAEAEESD